MAYGVFKDLARRTAANKVLRNKAFNIAKYLKYNAYQRESASTVYSIFDKRSAGRGVANNEIKQSLQLVEELRKLIIRKF